MSLSTDIRPFLPGNWRPMRLGTLVGLRWLAVVLRGPVPAQPPRSLLGHHHVNPLAPLGDQIRDQLRRVL